MKPSLLQSPPSASLASSKLTKVCALLASATMVSGCFNSNPSEVAFLKTAVAQLGEYKEVCLQVPWSGGYVSSSGGMPKGWVAYAEGATESSSSDFRNRPGNAVDKMAALVSVGVVKKEPYQLYQKGELVPAHKYFMTEEGVKLLTGAERGQQCLKVGVWQGEELVLPRVATAEGSQSTELIRKKTDGDTTLYEATVSLKLTEVPEWAKSPAIAKAYPETAAQLQEGKVVRVTLVQFNGEWMSRDELSKKLMKAERSPTASNTERPKLIEMSAELQELAIARMNRPSTGYDSRSIGLKLPLQASDLPTTVRSVLPAGSVLIVPGMTSKAYLEKQVADKVASFEQSEKSLAAMSSNFSPEQQAANERIRKYQLEGIARLKEGLANPSSSLQAQADQYLNQRKELEEVMEALVKVGAYQKKVTKAGDVAGLAKEGVLYTPADGTSVSTSGVVNIGTPVYKGPLRQKVVGDGAMLQLAADFELSGQPAWFGALSEELPHLKQMTKGTKTFMAMASSSPDFPYNIHGM